MYADLVYKHGLKNAKMEKAAKDTAVVEFFKAPITKVWNDLPNLNNTFGEVNNRKGQAFTKYIATWSSYLADYSGAEPPSLATYLPTRTNVLASKVFTDAKGNKVMQGKISRNIMREYTKGLNSVVRELDRESKAAKYTDHPVRDLIQEMAVLMGNIAERENFQSER